MNNQPSLYTSKFSLSFLTRFIALTVAFVGAKNMAAWFFGDMATRGLTSITMKTNTAVGFLFLGIALFLLVLPQPKKFFLWVARGLAGIVVLLGCLTCMENLLSFDFGIDQLLMKEPSGALGVLHPNRMGTPASLNFTLTGAALFLLSFVKRPVYMVQFLGWMAFLIGMFGVMGYLYGVQQMFGLAQFTAIAFPTAMTFVLLGIGIILVRPYEGMVRIFTATDTSRRLLSQVFFPFMGLALIAGYFVLIGERSGWYDSATGIGLMAISFIIFFTLILYRNAKQLNEKVTGQKRAQAALVQKEAELNEAQRIAHIGSWYMDAKTRAVTASPEVYYIQGLDPTKPYPTFREESRDAYNVTQDSWNRITAAAEKALQTGGDYEMDLEAKRPDGMQIWFTVRGEAVRNARGEIIGLRGTVQDITRRKLAAEELRKANEVLRDLTTNLEKRVVDRTLQLEEQAIRLRQLALELTATEQSERKRLAEMLHNHLQQLLVAAILRLDLMLRKSPHEKESIEDARGFINEAIEASRSLTAELRPPVLYEGGLIAALGFLVRKMQHQYKMTVRLSLSPDVEPKSDQTKAMIYECVKELLFNAAKYSGVDECFLNLERSVSHEEIIITIRDNGKGFDAARIGENVTGGFGLFSIRERIRALGGHFKVESSRGAGVKFEIKVPDNQNVWIDERDDRRKTDGSDGSIKGKGTLRILLADDHKIVRQSLAKLIGSQEFVQEIFEAEDGIEAVNKAKELHPDIVIMDLNMPKLNGIEATRILHEYDADLKIIGLSVQIENETAKAMRQAGAVAYFNKAEDASGLIQAIKDFAHIV